MQIMCADGEGTIDKWTGDCWVKFKAASEEGGVQKITCLC